MTRDHNNPNSSATKSLEGQQSSWPSDAQAKQAEAATVRSSEIQTADLLRASAYGYTAFQRKARADSPVNPSRPVEIEDIHESSLRRVTGSGGAAEALATAREGALNRLSEEIGSFGDLAVISKMRRSSTPDHSDKLKDNPEDANAAAWSAVCQTILKESTNLQSVESRRRAARDAGGIRFLKESPTHDPPPRLAADSKAFWTVVSGDQSSNVSRAKHMLVKTADGNTLYGATYTNRSGTFLQTPATTYKMYLEKNQLVLKDPDERLVAAEILGRVRKNTERQPNASKQVDKTLVAKRDLNLLTSMSIVANGDLNFSPGAKDEHTASVKSLSVSDEGSPASSRWHTVRLGETQKSIALKLFNDPSYATLLAKVNRLPEDSQLLKGMCLRMPTPADLEAYKPGQY